LKPLTVSQQAISKLSLAVVVIIILTVFAIGAYFLIPNNITGTKNTSTASVPNQGSSSQSAPPCGGNVWSTYHCDYARDGVDNNESNIHSPAIKWQSVKLDGKLYAEPLVAFGKVFVVTENDSVYALNATTGNVIWRTNVGQPVTSGTPCGDINPLGITGTPVLDLSTKTLYFVAEVAGGSHFLYGVNVSSGLVVFMRNIDPPSSTPIDQQQRSALALNDGIVYVELSGLFGDCGSYHGWVVGAQLNESAKLYTFEVASNGSDAQGGIWEVGGASIAPNGDLYVATGNSRGSQTYDYGDGVVQLSPTLQVLSYFAPNNYVTLNHNDEDLGSTGPILVNNFSLAFQVGKEGVGYLLSESNLGGINGAVFAAQVCNSAYSADSYYESYIFVPCTNGLFALKLQGSGSASSFSSAWNTDSFTSGSPIVSGNAVWTIDTDNGTLFALAPTSGATLFSYHLGAVVHFETPASADGMIFAGANDQLIAVSIST
jgi:outer membrane protein assembly factor BamB